MMSEIKASPLRSEGGSPPRGQGSVTVQTATNSDHGIQIIGHAKIGTINVGGKEDGAARRARTVLQWLSPSEEALKLQQLIHEESRINHKVEGTGSWFLESPEFSKWRSGRSTLTWMDGHMGCGKTVLFFLAVEEIRKLCREDSSKSFGYFYCTSRSSFGQNISSIFRSLLRQLCRPTDVPDVIQRLYDVCDEGLEHRSPTVHELARSLADVTAVSDTVSTASASRAKDYYLLIDGLDELEMASRDELLNELRPIISRSNNNVHVLISSRFRREIEESLQDLAAFDSFPINTDRVKLDIASFVNSEIQAHKQLSKLPQKVHDAIHEKVVKDSNGMFRWAFLQIQSLKALKLPVTPAKVLDKLKSLPKDLNETYARRLDDLDEFDRPKAKRALTWLLFSARQLYIEELAEACSIDVEGETLIDDKIDPSDVEILLQDLILIQPPLNTEHEFMNFQTHTVMLVHASIREFLLGSKSSKDGKGETTSFALNENDAQMQIGRDCLAYLLSYNTYELRLDHEDFPLQRYAWYHWEEHVGGAADHCVPTIPSVTLRRKAGKMFQLINSYLDGNADIGELSLLEGDKMVWHPTAFAAVMDAVRKFTVSHQLDIMSLKEALNVPYFHPDYDKFCPMATKVSKIGNNGHPPEPTTSFNDRIRTASYAFWELSEPGTWIRLLEILPAVDPNTVVRCRLFSTELSKAPPYAALSYSYDAKLERKVITIDGHAFHVFESQLLLLRNMRTRGEDLNPAIWLDALCIDQGNIREKAAQVSIVGDIFAQAHEVIVGLSKGGESDDRCVHLLADLASSTSLASSARKPQQAEKFEQKVLAMDQSGGWHEILRIFQHPWWLRRWIVQESVLGIRAVVLFGSLSFNFDLIEQVMLADELIRKTLRESQSPTFSAIEESRGWYAAKQISHTRREYRENRPLTLPALLWRFRKSISTDVRDTIFAFMGLCGTATSSQHGLAVDYHSSPSKIFMRTSKWILHTYKTLDVLSILSAYANPDDPELSSWSLFLHGQLLERPPLNPGIFSGAGSFSIYSAAGSAAESMVLDSEDESVLKIRGLVIDKIAKVIEPKDANLTNKTYFENYLKDVERVQNSDFIGRDSHKTIDARWRTLLADQWPFGARLGNLKWRGSSIPPETADEEKALLEAIDASYNIPQLVGRRVVATTSGRLGLALEEAQVGDEIAIMPGGAVPLVLRAAPESTWQFRGECYLYDCMDGQAVGTKSEPWYSEIFSIV